MTISAQADFSLREKDEAAGAASSARKTPEGPAPQAKIRNMKHELRCAAHATRANGYPTGVAIVGSLRYLNLAKRLSLARVRATLRRPWNSQISYAGTTNGAAR